MPLSTKAKELVDATWKHIEETSKGKAIYFDWQNLEASSIDSSSKLALLGVLADRYDKVLEEYKTADLSKQLQYLIPEVGQLAFLFHQIMLIPERDP